MPQTRLVKQITFGGDAINNPPNYDWNSYVNYPDLDLQKRYIRANVIVPTDEFDPLQVTGLLQLDANNQPMDGPNDLVYLPCPPFC